MRDIKEIIVHCSANCIDVDRDKMQTPEGIKRYHINNLHMVDCGYHFIIDIDGNVHNMRPVEVVGAHCKGHNLYSIGICYIGGLNSIYKPCDTRTQSQKHSLRNLILVLRHCFGPLPVFGHRDFANKACPCFDAWSEFNLDSDPNFNRLRDEDCEQFLDL